MTTPIRNRFGSVRTRLATSPIPHCGQECPRSSRTCARRPERGHSCPLPFGLPLAAAAVLLTAALPARAVEYIAFVGPVTVDTRRPDLAVATLDTPLYALAASSQPVAWTVLNQGAAPATTGWVDRVSLATNAAGTNARLLGEFAAPGPLGTNQALPRVQSIALPGDLEPDRDYWWIVVTDAGNALDESNELNNTRVADQPMRLLRSPAPNLRVASVEVSANPMSGQPVTVNWAVTNAGTWSTGAGLWQDAVYLSADAVLDAGDLLLGRATRPRPLGTNDSYLSSLTASLPQGLSGTRYFIVVADADNRVNEGVFENDNLTASAPVVITLTPPPDLQVAAIEAPANAVSGTSLAVSWTVTNAGPGVTAEAAWVDEVYLSPTPMLGTNALLLGAFPHEGLLANGGSYTASGSLLLAPSLSGPFYLLVHTDARSNVFEHIFETNNVAASPLPIVITLTPPPDLAVSAVVAPVSALASHPLCISYTVTNQGTDTLLAFFWEDRVWLSTNPLTRPWGTLSPCGGEGGGEGAIFLGSAWHFGDLLAGQSYTNSIEATLPDGLSGPWYAVVETDAGQAVFELNKTNNIRASATPILIESRPADLVVTSLTAPPSAQAGGSLLVSWSVRNQGAGDTTVGRWTDRLVLSADALVGNADDVAVLTLEQTGLLAPGESYTVSNQVAVVPWTVAPGTYRVFVVTDAGNAVYEAANEGNNASAPRTIAISRTTADLVVTAVAFAPAGGRGEGLGPLAAGLPLTPALSPSDGERESAAGGGGAPLAPTGGEGQGEGALPVFSEDTLLVSWRVENAGPVAPNSAVWSDAVYLSTNAVWSTNSILLGSRQNPSTIAPGAAYTNALAVTLPAEIQGAFFVHVVSDPVGQIIEDNRANNVLAATNILQVTLRPVPDLAVVSVATPADGFSGQPIELSWTVTNRGPAAAEGTWFDSVYLSLDPQFEPGLDTYIGYAERPTTLTNGQSYTQTATLRVPPEVSGLLYVFVVCDSTDRVRERGGETNNVGRAPQPVSVWLRPPADLVVGTITIPSNALAGYEMALTYVLRNHGTNAAFGPWVDALYLSADDQWDVGDVLFTRVSQTGFLAVGESRTNTVSAPAPGVLPGNYHVIIRTDVVNQVPETNEFNNITASLDRCAMNVQRLDFGVPVARAMGAGGWMYHRVEAEAGHTLRFRFSPQAPTSAYDLVVRFEAIPTRTEFLVMRQVLFSTNQELVLTAAATGSYYVGVFCHYALADASYSILADDLPAGLLAITPRQIGEGGEATLQILGSKFPTGVAFSLLRKSGEKIPAVSTLRVSETKAYATFDTRMVALGWYDVLVDLPDGPSYLMSDVVEIVPKVDAHVRLGLVGTDSMRLERNTPFDIWVTNAGNVDLTAPLLLFYNPGREFIGLTPATMTQTNLLQLLCQSRSGPAAILRPGQAETFKLVTRVPATAQAGGSEMQILPVVAPDPAAVENWALLRDTANDGRFPASDWQAFWAHLQPRIGTNWGDYVRFLNRVATDLAVTNRPVDVRELLAALYSTNRLYLASLSVSGVLQHRLTGQPLAGYELELRGQSGLARSVSGKATTDEQGRFVVRGLQPGEYALLGSGLYFTEEVSLMLEPNEDVSGLAVRAVPEEEAVAQLPDRTGVRMVQDGAGRAHLIWEQEGVLLHAVHEGTGWSPGQPIPGAMGRDAVLYAVPPSCSGMTNGLVLAWRSGETNSAEYFANVGWRDPVSGELAWSAPVRLTTNAVYDSEIALLHEPDGRIIVILVKADASTDDDGDLYLKRVAWTNLVVASRGELSAALQRAAQGGESCSLRFGYKQHKFDPARIGGNPNLPIPISWADKLFRVEWEAGGVFAIKREACEFKGSGGGQFRLKVGSFTQLQGEVTGNGVFGVNREECEVEFEEAYVNFGGGVLAEPYLPIPLPFVGVIDVGFRFQVSANADLFWIGEPPPAHPKRASGHFSVGGGFFAAKTIGIPWVGGAKVKLACDYIFNGDFIPPPEWIVIKTTTLCLSARFDIWALGQGKYVEYRWCSIGPARAPQGEALHLADFAGGNGELMWPTLDSSIDNLTFGVITNGTFGSLVSHFEADGSDQLVQEQNLALETLPQLSNDSVGTVRLAWAGDDGITVAVLQGETWGEKERIPASDRRPVTAMKFAHLTNGVPLVVWCEGADIRNIDFTGDKQQIIQQLKQSGGVYFSRRLPGTGWENPQLLYTQPGGLTGLALASGPQDQVWAFWLHLLDDGRSEILATCYEPQSGNWTAPVVVQKGHVEEAPSAAVVAGKWTLLWSELCRQPDALGSVRWVLKQSEWDGTAWSTAQMVTLPDAASSAGERTVIGRTTSPHVARSAMGFPFCDLEIDKEKCCDCPPGKPTQEKHEYAGPSSCGAGYMLVEDVRKEFNKKECTTTVWHLRRCVVRPIDPNDIVGPTGYGPELWVSGRQPMTYTIHFENDPKEATAPAQEVVIRQKLDPNLDWRSFRLGSLGFGATMVNPPDGVAFYQTRLDLTSSIGLLVDIEAGIDFATGEVFWKFTSIDPETGDYPWDPLAGFLPPNVTPPEGDGFVSYSILPRTSLHASARINAEARIFFDYNEPMDTPRIFNTIDATGPVSTVLPLPLATNRNIFPVQWAGADAYGGSGVAGFDVYVSENGGPWRLWLANTPQWEQLFVGECGHSYAFYSVARDNVGHVEAAVPAPQAQVYVLPNTPPLLAPLTNWLIAVGQQLVLTNLAADAESPAQGLIFSLDAGAPPGMTIEPHTGVLRWRPQCVQGNSVNWVTVRVTDDGCGFLSATQQFAVVVTECLQAALGGAVAGVGSQACMAVYLESSDDLTNLSVTVQVPPGRFTNFTATAAAPEVESATVTVLSPAQVQVNLSARPGQVLRGPKPVAELCFDLLPVQPSAFVWLEVVDILGVRPDGRPVGNTEGRAGRVAVVGSEPLLEAALDANRQPELRLYGPVGRTCVIEANPDLGNRAGWQPACQVTLTNLWQPFACPGLTNQTLFFRARRD